MKLGDKVTYTNSVSFEYNEDSNKVLIKHSKMKPIEGFIVRKTKKATGKYNKGYHSYYGGDFEPAYPAVDKYHTVYEIAYNIHHKPDLVLPEDIMIIDSSNKLL